MKLFTLLKKIKDHELDELPLKIRYHGKVYTKLGAAYTYYEEGQRFGDTLKIDTMDLTDEHDIEVVFDDEKPYEMREKIQDLVDKISDLIDELDELKKKGNE